MEPNRVHKHSLSCSILSQQVCCLLLTCSVAQVPSEPQHFYQTKQCHIPKMYTLHVCSCYYFTYLVEMFQSLFLSNAKLGRYRCNVSANMVVCIIHFPWRKTHYSRKKQVCFKVLWPHKISNPNPHCSIMMLLKVAFSGMKTYEVYKILSRVR